MDDFDKADLDGDGEFDGIDIAILDEEENNLPRQSSKQDTGCCLPFLIACSPLIGGGIIITRIIL